MTIIIYNRHIFIVQATGLIFVIKARAEQSGAA
jgi:hypothetical protein